MPPRFRDRTCLVSETEPCLLVSETEPSHSLDLVSVDIVSETEPRLPVEESILEDAAAPPILAYTEQDMGAPMVTRKFDLFLYFIKDVFRFIQEYI